jgi:hypothetical protein
VKRPNDRAHVIGAVLNEQIPSSNLFHMQQFLLYRQGQRFALSASETSLREQLEILDYVLSMQIKLAKEFALNDCEPQATNLASTDLSRADQH